MGKGVGDYATTIRTSIPRALHRITFSASSLSIGKHSSIESLKDILYQLETAILVEELLYSILVIHAIESVTIIQRSREGA